MATFGSGVQAGLGAIDYSPIRQGGMAEAQGRMQGAASIAQGIQGLAQGFSQGVGNYLQKQAQKKEEEQAVSFVKGIFETNPEVAKAIGISDPNDIQAIKAGIKAVGISPILGLKQDMDRQQQATQLAQEAARLQGYMQQGGGRLPSMINAQSFDPRALQAAQEGALQQQLTQADIAKTQAETERLRAPVVAKPENLSFQEQNVQARIAARQKELGRPLNEQELANEYAAVSASSSMAGDPQAKVRADLIAKDLEDVRMRGDAGMKLLPNIRSLEKQLDAGFETGKLDPIKTTVASIARAIGVPVDENLLAQRETAGAQFSQFMLEFIAATKGAITERENTLFLSMGPQLEKSTKANKALLGIVKDRIGLDVELARISRDGLSKNKPFETILAEQQAARSKYEAKYDSQLSSLEKEFGPPEGVLPAEWAVMTPEEQALFR